MVTPEKYHFYISVYLGRLKNRYQREGRNLNMKSDTEKKIDKNKEFE